MDYYENIAKHFQKTIENASMAVDSIAESIEASATLVSEALISGHKVMACGFGTDAALAQMFVAQSHSSLEEERPGLPMLTLPINEFQIDGTSNYQSDFFSPALKSLGQAGDVLFCIDSNMRGSKLVGLINLAVSRKIRVVVLSHKMQQDYHVAVTPRDVCILPSVENRTHLVELIAITIQCLSSVIDNKLFGENK